MAGSNVSWRVAGFTVTVPPVGCVTIEGRQRVAIHIDVVGERRQRDRLARRRGDAQRVVVSRRRVADRLDVDVHDLVAEDDTPEPVSTRRTRHLVGARIVG